MANGRYWDRFTQGRITRRRALQMAALTAGAAGAIAVVGCGGDDDDGGNGNGTPQATPGEEGTAKPGGTLRGTVSLVLGKDPMKASTFLTHALASYSYSRLMRFKTVVGELSQDEWYVAVPELATVENPDPLTYTFTIKPEAKWQNLPPVNGRAVTPEDVVYSFNRYREISPNKANFSFVESVEATGAQTVTFKLTEPFGLFLNRVASFQDLWIMPREFIEQSETASEDSMLGSGPFIFDRFEPSVVMAWRKNPDYWETDEDGVQLPYLDGVNLDIITDTNQVLSQFAAGNLDTISVPPQLLDSARSENPDAIFDGAPRNILSFLYFEPASYLADKPPFNDERVRRGMSMALNRDALLNRVSNEGGLWPSLPINAGFGSKWWLDPQSGDFGDAAKWYEYNPTEARALFEAAGFAGGFETPMYYSSTVYTTVVPYYDIVRQSLPALLQEVGVSVREVGEEYGVYIAKTFGRGEFEGFTFGLESVFSDVAAYWTNMFYPRDAGGGRNHSSVTDATLNDRIKAMLQLQDLDELNAENFELQKYVSDMMYYVPVVTPVEFAARQARLKGVLNSSGPTTYAVGTEGSLMSWLDV